MPPLSALQKAAVSQFVSITGSPDRVAQRFLKNSSYRVDVAVNAYFATANNAAPGVNQEVALQKQFDSLRNPAEDQPNTLGAESAMAYLSSLGVNMEDASFFVAMETLRAETLGEIPKAGFVEGWKAVGVDASIAAQRNHLAAVVRSLRASPDAFRKVYRYVFVCGKEPAQRALNLETAIVFWEMLFKEPAGRPWVGRETGRDFLELWKAYLSAEWTRSVNRDMWNQTLEFAFKSMDDERLSFWNEEGAWPGVIDDFVAWYRKTVGDGGMDVD